jgi:hypothetical protein
MGRYKVAFETGGFITLYAFMFCVYGRLAVEIQNFARHEC